MTESRAAHIAALKNERDALAGRTRTRPARMAAIEAELDKYASKPKAPEVETVVAGPISSRRSR